MPQVTSKDGTSISYRRGRCATRVSRQGGLGRRRHDCGIADCCIACRAGRLRALASEDSCLALSLGLYRRVPFSRPSIDNGSIDQAALLSEFPLRDRRSEIALGRRRMTSPHQRSSQSSRPRRLVEFRNWRKAFRPANDRRPASFRVFVDDW